MALEIARPRPALPAPVRDLSRAIKSLEHVRQIFAGNSLPGVAHRQHGQTVLRFQFHAHFAVWPVVLNGIGQQIGDDLRQPFGVAGDFQRRQLAMNFYAAFVRQRLHQFDAIGNRFGKSNAQPLQTLLPGVEPRQFQQRFNQFPHPLRRALAGFDGLLYSAASRSRFKRGLRLREHHRNRRAQFVRGIGGELFLLRKRGFEPGEGGIQNGGQLAEFAFGLGDVDALRQIAGGNFHGGRADVLIGRRRAQTNHQPPASQPTK